MKATWEGGSGRLEGWQGRGPELAPSPVPHLFFFLLGRATSKLCTPLALFKNERYDGENFNSLLF